MNCTRNAVYTKVVTAIKAAHASVSCTSRYVPKPATFPACYIHEIDRSRPLQYTQLDFEDNQWESSFEIQVVSTQGNTAASEAYAIMETARAAFSDLYYRQFSEASIDQGTQFTLIARFRRVIGGGDAIPTNTWRVTSSPIILTTWANLPLTVASSS